MPVAIITGANGVFGQHIAAGLLQHGFETVCVCRDEAKAKALVSNLTLLCPKGTVRYELVDCSRHGSIRAFAQRWTGPLDVLINNAAITPTTRQETPEGIESQWACNVLGYHWFIKEFERHLKLSSAPRVANVASSYAGGLNLEDPEFKKRPYNPISAYRASKQANRMLTQSWAKKLGPGIIFASSMPGVATSNVSLGLGFDLDRSSEAAKKGAVTPLFTVLDPSVVSGQYYSDCKQERCEFSTNVVAVDKLFDLLEKYSS